MDGTVMYEHRVYIKVNMKMLNYQLDLVKMKIEYAKKELQRHLKTRHLSYEIKHLGPSAYEDITEFVVSATRDVFDLRKHVEQNMRRKGLL